MGFHFLKEPLVLDLLFGTAAWTLAVY